MALEGFFDNRPGWRSTAPLGKKAHAPDIDIVAACMSAIVQFLRPVSIFDTEQTRLCVEAKPRARAFRHHHRRIICAVFLPPAWTQQGVRVALPSAEPRLMAKVGAHDGKRHSQARRPHIQKGPQRWRAQMGKRC